MNTRNKIALKMSFFLAGSSMLEASVENENIITLPEMYIVPMGLIILFVILVLVYSFLKQRTTLKDKSTLILEQEEKIKFLRQTHAEYEYKQTQKNHTDEKRLLELQHTISTLEEKINDGTKNQVVAKLEEYKNKRDQELKHVNLGSYDER